MLLAPLPYDYVKLLDPGDRVRKAQKRTTGRRTRRTASGPRD